MTEPTGTVLTFPLPLPGLPPKPSVDVVLSASPEAFMGIYAARRDRRDIGEIESAITQAEKFLASAGHIAGELQQAVELEGFEEIRRQLKAFVAAWPNASGADLAGYGLYLIDDVVQRQPCRYPLREALRHLRQTSRFLPSIAEVLAELDKAQARIRNTAFHIGQIPGELETARADLAAAQARLAWRRPQARTDGSSDQQAAAAPDHPPRTSEAFARRGEDPDPAA